MKDKGNGRQGLGIIYAIIACLLLAPLPAYLLSAGPVLWLVNHEYLRFDHYVWIYGPMIDFCADHPRFNDAINWYLSWWGPALSDPGG